MLTRDNDLVMLCGNVSMIGFDDDSADKTQEKLGDDEFDRQADTERLKTIRDLRSIIDNQKQTIHNLQAEVLKLILNN